MRGSFLVLVTCLAVGLAADPVVADGGGGEGGGGIMAGADPAPAGAAPRAAPGASGTSTLPGGAQIALSGPAGNRDVTVTTAEGKAYSGKHISTKRNPKTGITSVFIRNADGSRTGIHVDRQGNTSVSNHKR